VNNAFKFTEQGQVTVSARISHASGLTPHAFIEFKVADTGIGIAKEQIADIFTSFRQLQTVEVNPSSGMGFGLYIVKAFTDLLGGQVAVESELGKGSVFTITIPCRREEKPYGQEKNLSRG
jgi:signal transduction histidine kinase